MRQRQSNYSAGHIRGKRSSRENALEGCDDVITLLLHGRDVTSDTAEGVCSGRGAKAPTDLLLDFHHPQIPLGQIVVKGHRKVLHKGQRFGLILRQAVEQILAFVLFLAPPLPTGGRRVVVLFFQASLQERSVALLVV